MEKAEFSYNDFLNMQKQMQMFGSIEGILGMLPSIPGLNKDTKETIASEGEKQMKRIKSFISSMTPEERANPSVMNTSRKKRISAGCGIPMHEINQIIMPPRDQTKVTLGGMILFFKKGRVSDM